jgi:hypothetical protein
MKHLVFTTFIVLECVAVIFLLVLGRVSVHDRSNEIASKKTIVKELMLTDLALWTEARYTRHPSQADLLTPFQDFPAAMDHFPAGSIIAPPETIRLETKLIIDDKRQVRQ